MSAAAPTPIIVAFGQDGDKNVIPVLASPTPGLASYTTGFPPVTRLKKTDGGIPPAGLDFNGILNAVSDYCRWLQGGGFFVWDEDYSDANGGYDVGAVLRSAADPTQAFYNTLADNENDPDTVATGWVPFALVPVPTGTLASNIAAGSQVFAVTAAAGFVDLTPNAGNTTVTNFTGGSVGQIVTVTNMHASNSLTLQASANIRMVGDLTLLQNGSISLRRRTSTQWVAMS